MSRSTVTLLGSNLITIIIAVYEGWNLQDVMMIYWGQSVIVGLFNFIRMINLKSSSTKGLKMNGNPVDLTRTTQISTSVFFLFHYGLFHLAYLVFLLGTGERSSQMGFTSMLILVALFGVNHFFAMLETYKKDQNRQPNIRTIMFFPYARIFPMHLIVIAGGNIGGSSAITLVLFLLLKTGADLVMHLVEQRSNRV